jgi:hypothetical protein
MTQREPIDIDTVKAMITSMDLENPEARARVLAALPDDLVQLALAIIGGNLEDGIPEATATMGAMLATQTHEPFTVQHVDEEAVPGMVLFDLPDDEVLLVAVDKYLAGKRAIADAIGVEDDELDLTGLRLILDEGGTPLLEPPIN